MKRKSASQEPVRSACLVCPNLTQVRGLCLRCYAEARRAILANETTDAELVEQGLMLPALPRGRPLQNKMRAAIASMKRKPASRAKS